MRIVKDENWFKGKFEEQTDTHIHLHVCVCGGGYVCVCVGNQKFLNKFVNFSKTG